MWGRFYGGVWAGLQTVRPLLHPFLVKGIPVWFWFANQYVPNVFRSHIALTTSSGWGQVNHMDVLRGANILVNQNRVSPTLLRCHDRCRASPSSSSQASISTAATQGAGFAWRARRGDGAWLKRFLFPPLLTSSHDQSRVTCQPAEIPDQAKRPGTGRDLLIERDAPTGRECAVSVC